MEPQHVFVFVSQHWTPPASAGQLLAQSESVVQDGAHFFSSGGGGVGFEAGGSFGAAGGGSVALDSSVAGTSALLAQAAAMRTAVTANRDFERVAYFTAGTLSPALPKICPERLTTPFR